ncbi:hypothetical protein BGZ89_007895 [Linnemannia elongata]|nr:hypothetical protein BGZ89_007895 [Linnemannia elongata]
MVILALQNQTAKAKTTKDQAPAKIFPHESFQINPLSLPELAHPHHYSFRTPITIPTLYHQDLNHHQQDRSRPNVDLVHLGSYALHGAGLVFAEASAAESRGRITPGCVGVYSDDHIPAIKRVVDFVHSAGGKISVQLIHTERKRPVVPYPSCSIIDEIRDVLKAFGAAAVHADKAGMDTVEIQGSYGYLIHTFLSPLTNHHTDKYRGSLENRARLLLKVVREDCVEYLSNIPSFVIEEAVQVARWAKDAGLDIIHVVAVGHTPREKIPRFPDYLVHYAAQIRQDVPGLAVIAVRTINSGKQAQEIVESGKVDLVAAASVFLKHPTFALDAGRELGVDVTYAPLHPCRYA